MTFLFELHEQMVRITGRLSIWGFNVRGFFIDLKKVPGFGIDGFSETEIAPDGRFY